MYVQKKSLTFLLVSSCACAAAAAAPFSLISVPSALPLAWTATLRLSAPALVVVVEEFAIVMVVCGGDGRVETTKLGKCAPQLAE